MKELPKKLKTIIRGTIYAEGGEKLAYTDTNSTEEDLSDDTRKYPYGKIFCSGNWLFNKGLLQDLNRDVTQIFQLKELLR